MDSDTKAPVIATLDELRQELNRVFSEDKVDVDYVKDLLSAYKSNPADWKQYAKFDKFRYTRNMVDDGNGKYNLIALCWGEGHGSSIHDHSNSHCFVKILDGQLMETMFRWPTESETEQGMQEKAVYHLGKNEVTYINDTMGLHRVENPSHVHHAVSLHLYSPPFDYCRTFDQRTGYARPAKVTFWSKFGQRLPVEVNECSEVKAPILAASPVTA